MDERQAARILIIDDQESSALGLARIVEKGGYAVCITMTDPQLALNRFIDIAPDLVLLDFHMEPISGVEVLEGLSRILEPHKLPPILMLTADTSPEAKHQALLAGASDFLSKPLDHFEVTLRIRHLLQSRSYFLRCQNYSQSLEQMVHERTAELQKRTQELEDLVEDLQSTQKQLVQQERIRALGTMASGIAHDMNNSLTLILGYSDMLLEDRVAFPSGTTARASLQHIVRAARDNAHMVKRLREFYRPKSRNEERQSVDLNELVAQVVELTAPKWQAQAEGQGVNIQIEHDPGDIPVVAGSPAELREVLTNLIFNSVDAMPRGGTITLATRALDDCVRLEITDTGTGMTEDTQRRCLEPFYTTKGEKGSGLGLAMSYGIIRRHGGNIDIVSSLNHGTTFIIDLPIKSVACLTEPARAGRATRPLHVLVVDDQEGIREIVSAYLAEDRHTVETAKGATEAMAKFQQGSFDLVITDRAMPEINGDELAASIKRLNPREPIIMLTGFADLISETGERNHNVDILLGKPARLDDLRRAIAEAIPA